MDQTIIFNRSGLAITMLPISADAVRGLSGPMVCPPLSGLASVVSPPSSAFFLDGIPLRPGLILNMSSRSTFGLLTRMALAPAYKRLTNDPHPIRNCPSHSAMTVLHDGRIWIGEAHSPRAGLTAVDKFQWYLDQGIYYNLHIMEVVGATMAEELAASDFWMEHVFETPYDGIAMPRLLLKAIFGDLINTAAGVPWAHWCTEANMESWRDGAHRDPYGNKNPTPLTELKRLLEGKFRQLNLPRVAWGAT